MAPRARGSIDARIAALSSRYELPPAAADKLGALARLLVTDPLAPTAVRDLSKAVDDHLADSLVALELEQTRSASTVADLGSGTGIPGLPLAIALPAAEVALVESNARKCAFIERAVAACQLDNARVIQARAEAWSDGIGTIDLVTARALAPLAVVAEYAAPLLRLGGTVIVWRGRRDRDGEVEGAAAAEELGLEPREIRRVRPYAGAEHRHLHVMTKVSRTPPGFPRRPGMARKRPLGRVATACRAI